MLVREAPVGGSAVVQGEPLVHSSPDIDRPGLRRDLHQATVRAALAVHRHVHPSRLPGLASQVILRRVSFGAGAARVRDKSKPLGVRAAALSGCVTRFCPLGFHATMAYLRDAVGARDGRWTEAQLVRALELLEESRRSWLAERTDWDDRRRREKSEGPRSVPTGSRQPTPWPGEATKPSAVDPHAGCVRRPSATVGFDCASLVQYAYHQGTGKTLPRVADAQTAALSHVPPGSKLRAGDLLFFHSPDDPTGSYHHVGIYDGQGGMVHAPRTGKTVEVVHDVLTNPYFSAQLAAVARVDVSTMRPPATIKR